MSATAQRTLDCKGLKCPAPIMQLAKASRELGSAPAALTILSDDEAFAADLKAWCRTRPDARIVSFDEKVGIFTAVVSLNGGQSAAQAAPAPVNGAANGAANGVPHAGGSSSVLASEVMQVDCRGLKCPAPIMEVAKRTRGLGSQPAALSVQSDDEAFAADLKAWCRTRPDARILSFDEKAGVFTAVIGLNGADHVRSAASAAPVAAPPTAPVAAPAAAPVASAADAIEIDCRGLKCPAPIMELARRTRDVELQGRQVRVVSTDSAFPNDVKAWARMSKATVLKIDEVNGEIVAMIQLAGEARPAAPAPAPTPAPQPAPAPVMAAPAPAPPAPTPASAGGDVLDCRGMQAPTPILTLSQKAFAMAGTGGDVRVQADYPTFANDLMAWCQLTGNALVGLAPHGAGMEATVRITMRPEMAVQAPMPAAAPSLALVAPASQQPEVAEDDGVQKATLLLMHNDLDAALAAMLVATGAASQGMDVSVFFSFWGVNVLRGEKQRVLPAGEGGDGGGFLQGMMKMMMPKGPTRLTLSKMNMAGMGTWMMRYLMRKQNIMSLQQMMDACLELNVRFLVCTMSMELMGISKADLVDLPNMEYLGVASFVTEARRSKMTMTF